MKKWSGVQTWTTLVVCFTILLIVIAFFYPMEVRLVPFVVGFPTLGLLIILWIGGFYPRFLRRIEEAMGEKKRAESTPDRPDKDSEFTEWTPVLVIMAWVFLFFILVFLFGFALVSPVFIACFLIRKADMRWYVSFACAVFATIIVYVFMEGLIKADLWSGAIPTIIPGILGGAIIPPL